MDLTALLNDSVTMGVLTAVVFVILILLSWRKRIYKIPAKLW